MSTFSGPPPLHCVPAQGGWQVYKPTLVQYPSGFSIFQYAWSGFIPGRPPSQKHSKIQTAVQTNLVSHYSPPPLQCKTARGGWDVYKPSGLFEQYPDGRRSYQYVWSGFISGPSNPKPSQENQFSQYDLKTLAWQPKLVIKNDQNPYS